jgi:hypothetical protein
MPVTTMSQSGTDPKHFVITGCCRSGTTYAAEVLKALGVKCGHEECFHVTGFHTWGPFEGDSTGHAAPFLKGHPEPLVILHQTRHPLRYIETATLRGRYRDPKDFIEKHIPGCSMHGEKEWVQWNWLVEVAAMSKAGHVYYRYQVERLPDHLPTILRLIGHSATLEEMDLALAGAKKNETPGRWEPWLKWEDFADDWAFVATAKRYGY